MKKIFGVLTLTAVLLIGCKDDAPTGIEPGLGNITVNKYVSIGNSLTAGYQSSGLSEEGQQYSYPALIAQQLQIAGASLGKFEQPIWGNPGSPNKALKSARLEILAWPSSGPVIGTTGALAGTATNSALTRPYDNLGIPGAVVADFLDETDFIAKAGARENPFFPHVLRSAAFGKSIYEQAKNVTPKADVITFWLGNNDVLGFATSGGVIISSGVVIPITPTDKTIFATQYTQAFASLRAAFPNAKIVVANIPDVRSIPYFNTVGPAVAANLKGAFAISYQKRGNTGPGDGASYLTEKNPPLLTLASGAYASLISKRTGKWYKDNNIPVPAGIDTTAMFGLDYTNPIPDALILDSVEQKMAGDAIAAFNQTIANIAAEKGAAVVDVNTIFNTIKANGLKIGGETFNADYITGGLFSLDGVHPSSKGAGVVANEFIKAMNAKFGMSVSQVDVSRLPGIPAPLGKYTKASMMPKISAENAREMMRVWNQK